MDTKIYVVVGTFDLNVEPARPFAAFLTEAEAEEAVKDLYEDAKEDADEDAEPLYEYEEVILKGKE